ncbi:hypothetical protein FCX21_20555, partial [Escherichia coli]|nr:hypothetical protein [Escherichia coli]
KYCAYLNFVFAALAPHTPPPLSVPPPGPPPHPPPPPPGRVWFYCNSAPDDSAIRIGVFA